MLSDRTLIEVDCSTEDTQGQKILGDVVRKYYEANGICIPSLGTGDGAHERFLADFEAFSAREIYIQITPFANNQAYKFYVPNSESSFKGFLETAISSTTASIKNASEM